MTIEIKASTRTIIYDDPKALKHINIQVADTLLIWKIKQKQIRKPQTTVKQT